MWENRRVPRAQALLAVYVYGRVGESADANMSERISMGMISDAMRTSTSMTRAEPRTRTGRRPTVGAFAHLPATDMIAWFRTDHAWRTELGPTPLRSALALQYDRE